jgi:hypothetical protein
VDELLSESFEHDGLKDADELWPDDEPTIYRDELETDLDEEEEYAGGSDDGISLLLLLLLVFMGKYSPPLIMAYSSMAD